jgi:hypothetical protein
MKKLFVLGFAALSFAACSDNQADTSTTDRDRDDTMDNSATVTTSTPDTAAGYTAVEGDVTYTGNKVRVMRNREWVEADNDITLDDGTVVYRNGRVKKQDREIRLNDGEVVTRTGNFFDKSGRAIENAWDATKEGAKKAGKAIENTADKVGEKAKKAVKDDDNDQ